MSKQPESLRLAEVLFGMTAAFKTPSDERGVLNGSASELRRQHAEIERLQADLEVLTNALADAQALCRHQGAAIGVLKSKPAMKEETV